MERGDKGRFTQNNGGGPGRPKGSRNRSRVLADAINKVFGGESEFIEIILQAAKNGSEPMQKQILDRLIPPASRQSVLDHHLDIGEGTAAERANKIISASLEGEISLEEANALVAMLTSTARLEELEQVKAELEQLKTRIYGDKR
ncbi:hypothetical protein [Aeromonas rivipollensis]|uniref:hypothetical protein n=1 Tax=Aeromonas TaxID=642 RepID=UPI003D2080AF